MANGERFFRGLQGAGAGILGQLPQFQAGLERQEERRGQLSAERRKAMAVDFRSILGHLEAGNTNRALTLLNNRQAEIGRLGGDPASTEFLSTLISTGDIPQAQQFLEGIDREFVNEGTLQPITQAEPFTLAPGARRFGPGGEQIAENIPREGTLQPITQAEPFTLAPGARRFGPGGEQIAENIPRERAPTSREAQIADLRAQGLSRADAANIADGNVRIEVSDQTGNVVLTNVVDGSVKEVPIQPSGEPIPRPEPGQTLFELAPLATGFASGISAGISRVGGQFGGPVDEAVLEARQTIRVAKNGLIRSLSINPRFPVAEIQRIEKEVSLEPSVFNSEQALQADMIAIDRALTLRMNQQLRDANDPSFSQEDRGNARKAASDINNFLVNLGAPRGTIDISRITLETIPDLPVADIQRFIESATNEQLDALSPEIVTLLFERSQNGR